VLFGLVRIGLDLEDVLQVSFLVEQLLFSRGDVFEYEGSDQEIDQIGVSDDDERVFDLLVALSLDRIELQINAIRH
jgi:hypothetical protein